MRILRRIRAEPLLDALVPVGLSGLALWVWMRLGDAGLLDTAILSGSFVAVALGLWKSRRGRAALRDALAEIERRLELTESELNGARGEAKAAGTAGSRLLSAANHEIRAPMSGILGMAELLLETNLDPDQRQFSEAIDRSGRELLATIEEILDFARAETGVKPLQRVPLDLREVVEDAGDLRTPEVSRRGIQLVTRVDPGAPHHLIGDPERLGQLIGLLAREALRSVREGPLLIDASCRSRSESSARIRLAALFGGCEIDFASPNPPAEAGAEDPESADRVGTGAGLAFDLAQRLATGLGGEAGIAHPPRGGTALYAEIELPLDSERDARPIPGALTGLRVLVADGCEVAGRVLSEKLDSLGVGFHTLASRGTAFSELRRACDEGQPYTVALLDIRLPGGGGDSVAAEIRRDPRLDALALICLVPVGASLDPAARIAAGFAQQLSKPVRLASLAESLLATHRNAGSNPRR